MANQSPEPTVTEEALSELPPSAKLVAKTLEYEGESTQPQLAEETLLAGRTVRAALTQLKEEDIVASRSSFVDARKKLYSLNTGCENSG